MGPRRVCSGFLLGGLDTEIQHRPHGETPADTHHCCHDHAGCVLSDGLGAGMHGALAGGRRAAAWRDASSFLEDIRFQTVSEGHSGGSEGGWSGRLLESAADFRSLAAWPSSWTEAG